MAAKRVQAVMIGGGIRECLNAALPGNPDSRARSPECATAPSTRGGRAREAGAYSIFAPFRVSVAAISRQIVPDKMLPKRRPWLP